MKTLRLAVLVLIASLVGAMFAVVPVGAATAANRSLPVPLVECSTGHAGQVNPKSLPAAKTVNIPAADQLQLSAYTDDQGELYLLAPRGWTCWASMGADGNDYIDAYPQGEVGTATRSWPKTAQAVTADFLPACLGCVLSQACTYFPVAEQQLVQQYGSIMSCPKPPIGELTDRLTSTVVAYEDPPGIKGTQSPSGGNYAANGVVTYKPQQDHRDYGSTVENCVLPTQVHALCTAALNDFASEWDRDVAGG